MRRGKVDRALLARVAQYARPYLRLHGVLVLAIVAMAILSVVPALLVRDIIDVAIPAGSVGRVTVLGLLMLAVPMLSGGLEFAQHWAAISVGEAVTFDLRRALFRHLHRMDFEFYVGTSTGELMARLGNDVKGAQQAVAGSLATMVSGAATATATLVTMLAIEWRLTLLALSVLPLFYVIARVVARLLRKVVRRQMDSVAVASGHIVETLNADGAMMVKLFGRADLEDERFGAEAAEVARLGVRREVLSAFLALAMSLAGIIGMAVVFWIGATLVVGGGVQVGDVVALSLLLGMLYRPLGWLATAPVEFATAVVSFERVFEVLDMPPAIVDHAEATDLGHVEGRVEFRDVDFRYQSSAGLARARRHVFRPRVDRSQDADDALPEGDPLPTLEGVSFVAQPGSLVALVGPSGAGKTTIGYLVPRLLDVTGGSVMIDGRDVRDITLASLIAGVGIVTQDPHLLHDTVAANLRYAKPAATQPELEAACAAANVHDVIAALPDGYQTVVGVRGYRLSGGERQRLAIARVILEDPPIVILDEATSHLDSASEALVQDALEALWQDRTSLVIAHRLSTIVAADQILVVDGGRIAERGTHDQLLAAGGLYARLYETQVAGQPDAIGAGAEAGARTPGR